MGKRSRRTVANNKKAFHDYTIEDRFEAGIVLTGTEIKSVRKGSVSIKESYCKVTSKGELVVTGMHIAPYEQGNRYNVDPLRVRTLLMHKKEILKLYDKREAQAKRDAERKMDKAVKASRQR